MEPACDNSCAFCSKFGPARAPSRVWYDEVITQSGHFVVVPALGALVEGYVLVVSMLHDTCVAHLSDARLTELQSLLGEVRTIVSQQYGGVIVFEHGPALPLSSGGSCIDHAHLHVVPTEIRVDSLLAPQLRFVEMGDLSELRRFRRAGRPYVALQTQEGHLYCADATGVGSQFMRRLLAQQLGRPDECDYAVFPEYANMRATLRTLVPWPSKAPSLPSAPPSYGADVPLDPGGLWS